MGYDNDELLLLLDDDLFPKEDEDVQGVQPEPSWKARR